MTGSMRALAFGAALGALALAGCGEEPAVEADAVEAPAAETAQEPAEADMATTETAAPEACDRACLTGLITTYLDALVAGDDEAVPFADGAVITEDQVEISPGEGIWSGEVALTDYRFDIIDEEQGIAATLVKLEENGVPVLMAMRLLTEEGAITGVESFVVRDAEEGMIYEIDAIQTLSEEMAYTPAEAERNTREEMVDAAIRYPEGLKVGSFVTSDVPFSETAYRFENGRLMAGPGCTFLPGCENIKEQSVPTLSALTYRVAAVDEAQGVVLIRMDFGPGSIFPAPGRPENQSLSVFEAFKVWGDEVHAVEAFMEMKPADQELGWD